MYAAAAQQSRLVYCVCYTPDQAVEQQLNLRAASGYRGCGYHT